MMTFPNPSNSAETAPELSQSLHKVTPRLNRRLVGIGRPIRMAIVAAALREAGVTNPTFLSTSETRR